MSDNSDFVAGPGESLFGNPDASDDNADDWVSWDWHEIEAAINGGMGLTTQAEEQRALTIADPTTLQVAADVFYTVQQTLQAVGDDLVKQATILAGPNDDSPWKGDAANAFLDMIQTFANDIYANVNALKDATGASVADMLIDNANWLAWAQSQISYIDSYYANLAMQQGGSTDPSGAVQIHKFPNLVNDMNTEMHVVMNALTTAYNAAGPKHYPTAIQPQAVTPNGGTNLNNLNNLFDNNTGDPNLNLNIPNFAPPVYPNINPNIDIPNFAPPDYGNFKIPNITVPNPNITSPNGSDNIPNPTDLGPNLSNGDPTQKLDLAAPNALNLNPGLGNPNGLNLDPGGMNNVPNLTGGPNTTGDNPADLTDPGLAGPGLSNYNALNPAMDEALNPGLASPNLTSGDPLDDNAGLPNSEDQSSSGGADPALDESAGEGGEGMPFMPGTGGGASPSLTSEPSDSSGLLGNEEPFTGDTPLTSDELGSSSDTAPGAGIDGEASGEGMPYMPGMGGGASPSLTSEPSDSSGLLSNEDPFTGDSPLTSDDLGSPAGTAAGESAAEQAASGEGMPFMPGMGGGAGPTSSSDPSDASGLLEGESEPWAEPESAAGDEIGSADGAQAASAGEELPFMPGMGGAGQAGGAQGAEERSDAAGLLAEGDESWTGEDEEHAGEVGSADGAAPAEPAQAAWLGAAMAELGLDAAGGGGAVAQGAEQQAPEPARVEEHGVEEHGVEEHSVEVHGVEEHSIEAQGVGAHGAAPEPVAEHHHDDGGGDRVPVVGKDGSDEDLSGWDLAGAAADAALFTLGAWADRRRGSGAGEGSPERIVTTEQEQSWLDADAELAEDEQDDGMLGGVVTWRPVRGTDAAGDAARMPMRTLRVALPPKDYDPVAAAEAAAEAAEEAEAERVAAAAAEDGERRQRTSADLLTQDRDMWGTPRTDWDAL